MHKVLTLPQHFERPGSFPEPNDCLLHRITFVLASGVRMLASSVCCMMIECNVRIRAKHFFAMIRCCSDDQFLPTRTTAPGACPTTVNTPSSRTGLVNGSYRDGMQLRRLRAVRKTSLKLLTWYFSKEGNSSCYAFHYHPHDSVYKNRLPVQFNTQTRTRNQGNYASNAPYQTLTANNLKLPHIFSLGPIYLTEEHIPQAMVNM